MAGYIMTVDQALDAALAGGFYFNHGIIYIVAIGWAESRWKTDARHLNDNGTIDRGWLQINSIHSDISDADCDDPVKAAAYAFTKLSSQGTSFSAWSAYTSGAYRGPDSITWTAVTKAFSVKQQAQQILTLQNQISNLQDDLAADESEITDLSASLSSANGTIASLQSQLSTAQGNLSACQSASAAKDTTISSLNTKITNARSALA